MSVLFFLMGLCTTVCSMVLSSSRGKIDVAPAYAHVDVLQSGKTIKRLDMFAGKGDATILIWHGLCLKPTVLYGKEGKNSLFSGGIGLGHYTPLTDKFTLTPSVGCLYTQLRSQFMLDSFEMPLHAKQRFQSVSPYAAMEMTWCFAPTWRVCAQYQYCWSHSHTVTKVALVGNQKDNSKACGPNYAIMLEKDLTQCLSINLGAAYNISLSKEKHGLRGYGVKLGIAYWY